MADIDVQCPCGSAKVRLSGDPAMQGYCHCDDCQAAHGAAYVPRAMYPAGEVKLVSGETRTWTYKTNPRTNCAACGFMLWIEAEGFPFKAVNAQMLPTGRFKPQHHQQCRFAVAPVVDGLPHYADLPKQAGGSGDLVGW